MRMDIKILSLVPACAGVILAQVLKVVDDKPCPRVCGGDPILLDYLRAGYDLSPRVRG